ncbi:MAG: DnaD domain protein [Bacilli bacterium]|nr:DnaD domain protein [Bacilli bacterium]
MSNAVLEKLVKEKDYCFKKQLFKVAVDYDFSLAELLVLIHFINLGKPDFNINQIKEVTYLSDVKIMEAFSLLTSKKLISVNVVKEETGKIKEVIDLSRVYRAMVSEINTNIQAKNVENIFTIFEKEFGRTLSPIEFEIINAWLKSGTSEELIIKALKEATFNGVSNLRYIDKIIYEWGKKGLKTGDDVDNHLKKSIKKDVEPLFDYNWLDDE